ncbi:MAG: electron transport complex subunit RsxE, partial [Chromatiales bacterium]|nr:electron transport complex subunit RsxE [Chromatiales bacterium]
MSTSDYRQIFADGLWHQNAGIVQLLGLCPLLAVTTSLINGLTLGLASTLVMLGASVSVSLARNHIPREIRLPVFVLVIAAFVTAVDMLMSAYLDGLHRVLGIFVPLIVTNCAIIGRVEAFASRQAVVPAAADAVATGLGFTAVLASLGAMRELVGFGRILGELSAGHSDSGGLLIAILPPGAF